MKRKLYIMKCQAYVWLRHLTEKVLLQLSEWGLIVCHNVGYSNVTDDGKIHPAPDFTSERYIFSASYILGKYEAKHEYWFETKSGKRIFTVDESHHAEGRIAYRAELKAFFAHFSPRQRMWVDYTHPEVNLFDNKRFLRDLVLPTASPLEVKTHRCDFSQCRYAFEFRYALDQTSGTLPEVISQSHRAFGVQLTSKITEINKILTGADHDGEMMSPDNTPLSDNLLCGKCGLPVFASAKRKYSFWCLKHGELEYPYVQKVDPVVYGDVLENTMEILEDLIANFDTTECPSGL